MSTTRDGVKRGTLIDFQRTFPTAPTHSWRSGVLSGTPCFMSPLLFEKDFDYRRRLRHDLDSFFFVLLYVAGDLGDKRYYNLNALTNQFASPFGKTKVSEVCDAWALLETRFTLMNMGNQKAIRSLDDDLDRFMRPDFRVSSDLKQCLLELGMSWCADRTDPNQDEAAYMDAVGCLDRCLGTKALATIQSKEPDAYVKYFSEG